MNEQVKASHLFRLRLFASLQRTQPVRLRSAKRRAPRIWNAFTCSQARITVGVINVYYRRDKRVHSFKEGRVGIEPRSLAES
jgi:hypothetical protein